MKKQMPIYLFMKQAIKNSMLSYTTVVKKTLIFSA